MNKNFVPRKHNILKRNVNNYDKRKFFTDFTEINWEDIINVDDNDTNASFNSFFSKFNNLLDTHLPLKKISIKNFKRRFKPWITLGIITSIKKRNNIRSRFLRAKSIENRTLLESQFKLYRNLLVTLIRKSKENHFRSFFSENTKNLRETWKGIRNIIEIKSKGDSFPTCILENGSSITDPIRIANKFNSYFTSIAHNIQSKIHSSHTNFTKYLKEPNMHNFFISPTSRFEVFNLISKLKTRKASGPNSIPTVILKQFNNEISNILSDLFNLSFSTGVFPDILKTSSVLPLFKKGSKLSCGNYRPISLLSNISKLFEKLMYSRLYSFLKIYNCLNELQFGFQANHSTAHALLSITEKIRNALDTDHFACGVFIDLRKAFDTVDHKILVKKLEHYGSRGIPKHWFSSYLSNRKQFVSINGFKSSLKQITCGVPQGSVLGPLLFLIYINDLSFSVKHSTVYHFADDTNLLCINKSLKSLCKQINYDLKKLTDWLNGNRISLNTDKTEFVIFRKPRKKINLDEINIKLNGKRLFASSHIKYLGVLIDENLSWNFHIHELSKKLNRANSMLSKVRHYVDKNTLRSLYFSIFSSHMSYCCQIWGQTGNRHINKILSLQRSALRIINFLPFRCNVSNYFLELNIISFVNLVKITNLLFVYDSLKNNLPSSISNYFTLSSNIHSYNTRNVEIGKLHVPRFNSTKFGKNSIKYQCITEWNKSLTLMNNTFKNKNVNNPNYTSFLDATRSQFKKLLHIIIHT